MKKALLIAEKPSLMKAIQSAYREKRSEFDFDIDFLSQAGHLVGLKMPDEIDKEKYKKWAMDNFPLDVPYKYKVLPGKTDLVSKIKSAVKSGDYDFIIHAGDPDGEGELLVRLVLDYVGNKLPVERFWVNDQTPVAIVNGLKNLKPDSEYDRVYYAALVRQHADYQFGMNITGVSTLKMGQLYKLGRVKAAIIRMLVDRERAIRDFVQTSTWKRSFVYKDCEFVNDDEFDTKEKALKAMPVFDWATVINVKDEVKAHKAPKLFKLSTLQTEAYKRLHFSSTQTLATLQKLYEAQMVTYPRTDCEYISSNVDIYGVAKRVCPKIGVDDSLLVRNDIKSDKSYVNDKAIAAEGHTAIMPTGSGNVTSLGENERRLYDLIARRYLAIFAAPKKVRNVTVTAVPGNDQVLGNYVWKESSDVEAGYELVFDKDYKMKAPCGVKFTKGDTLKPVDFAVKECVAKPPVRYNDGSLIAAMDKDENFEGEDGTKVKYKIGTQATRASIIKDCIQCGYINVEKGGAYAATQKAEQVIDEIGDVSLFNVDNSGRWEFMLEQIRHGEADYREVESTLLKECQDATNDIKGRDIKKSFHGRGEEKAVVLGKCPKCGNEILDGKFGAYCQGKCGIQLGKAMGKILTAAQVRSLLAGKKTMVRGIESKKKPGTTYDAYLKMTGTEDFSYKKSDGTTATGTGLKFEISFQ